MNPVELSPEAAEILKSLIEQIDAPYRFFGETLLPFANELASAGYLTCLGQNIESYEQGTMWCYYVTDRLVSAREVFRKNSP